MRITHFEILRVPPSWVWLKIHTDTELYGWVNPTWKTTRKALSPRCGAWSRCLSGKTHAA